MKLDTVSVSYKRIVNTGNYTSVTAECVLGGTLEEGDDQNEALRLLWKQAQVNVAYALAPAEGKARLDLPLNYGATMPAMEEAKRGK